MPRDDGVDQDDRDDGAAGGRSRAVVSASDLLGGPIPAHVACVMDGNGRWAARRGLARTEGHAAG
jgi:undecaprenyl diphosphate synthase